MGPSAEAPRRPDDEASDLVSRRAALKRLGALGLTVPAAGLLAACSDDSEPATSEPVTTDAAAIVPTGPPNILLIVADDMRLDHLDFMPNVQELIQAPGRTFAQGRCNVALCQPARVGLMTGQTSKYNNEVRIGFDGTALEDHDNCIGAWMADAGYRCALMGKYVNFIDNVFGIKAPKGYETWREMMGVKDPYDFEVRKDDDVATIQGEYTTDYLAREASEFIAGGGPFMCIVTPTEAHAPFTPREDLADLHADVDWPIVDELDVSDKPPWVQELEPLTDTDRTEIQQNVRGALRELAAVDDMVRRIIESMTPEVLANTVVIFTSDNGVHHGEHRRRGAATKSGAYDVGLRVPLLVRGPSFEPGPDITTPSMVFQDLTATFVDLGGATPGLPNQEGISLRTLVQDDGAMSDRIVLHEGGEGFMQGDGITTGPDHPLGYRKLFRFPTVRENPEGPFIYEAYDLDTDPDEWSNWADDESRRAERDVLEAELLKLLA